MNELCKSHLFTLFVMTKLTKQLPFLQTNDKYKKILKYHHKSCLRMTEENYVINEKYFYGSFQYQVVCIRQFV